MTRQWEVTRDYNIVAEGERNGNARFYIHHFEFLIITNRRTGGHTDMTLKMKWTFFLKTCSSCALFQLLYVWRKRRQGQRPSRVDFYSICSSILTLPHVCTCRCAPYNLFKVMKKNWIWRTSTVAIFFAFHLLYFPSSFLMAALSWRVKPFCEECNMLYLFLVSSIHKFEDEIRCSIVFSDY